MRTRVFRILVCLVVICALLVNVSPVRAKAVSAGVAVGAGLVAVSMLYGLGVSIGEYPDVFNSLLADAISSMEMAGVVITNGMMDVMSLGSGLYGVKSDVIQNLFDWLWVDSGVITATLSGGKYFPAGSHINRSAGDKYWVWYDQPVYSYIFDYTNAADVFVSACATPGVNLNMDSSWGLKQTFSPQEGSDYAFSSATDFDKASCLARGIPVVYQSTTIPDLKSSVHALLNGNLGDGLTVEAAGDLTLNFVANPGVSLATGYPAWHANSVTIPNAETGEDEVYYPIALGNSLEETQGMTQEQVWAGEGTYVDTETGTGTGSGSITVPDTVTLKDILTGILSVPQSIAQAVTGLFSNVVAAVQAIPAAITDFFTITSDDLTLPVTWTDFFPFCIPSDIKSLVTILDAEPEAPHFEFDLQLPFQAEPYQIVIDLSEFDPLAQLLRRLELMVFIIGLAMATRNYYIRG